MKKSDVHEVILDAFRNKKVMKDLAENENFFGKGISSLTVVELQIVVEKALCVTVDTSELMRTPTINNWVDIYYDKVVAPQVEPERVAAG